MFIYTFLPGLLNMSLTAGVVILFVLLLRLLLKKAPKVISYALWGIVLFRLLCPVSIQSDLSLFRLLDTPVTANDTITSRIEYIPSDIVRAETPPVSPAVPGTGDVVGGMPPGGTNGGVLPPGEATGDALPQGGATGDGMSQGGTTGRVLPQGGTTGGVLPHETARLAVGPFEVPMTIAACVWMTGALAMVLYTAVSCIRLRRKLLTASLLRDNIYLADEITSPFVMGVFRPKIFLPSSIKEREQPYILAHEQHHISRFDHIVKPLAFAALCVHWFNPLVWCAFILAGKDMEMSCDEAVVRKMGADVLADYTASLLSLATGKHIAAGMSPAFGEGDAKGRIRNLANWKKPAFWVVPLSVLACAAAAVCFLTNPGRDKFSLCVVVPAGSQASMVYTHEEISPLGNYIYVIAGDGLGDTEVQLKPVEVKTETAYDEPVYLTPGMPVKMEAEKGGWFKIGVNVQNPSDEEKIVYVDVENVTVRISEVNEPETFLMEAEILEIHDGSLLVEPVEGSPELNSADKIEVPVINRDTVPELQVGDIIEVSYSGQILETYPARLSDVYSIRVISKKVIMREEKSREGRHSGEEGQSPEEDLSVETNTLSLNDVIMLSQYGQDLTWSDFEQYDYTEVGSGLYIRKYEIDGRFRLWIGGGGPDSDPMYIYLALADGFETRIDIRDGGTEAFIAEHRSEDPLTEAVYNAILEHNMPAGPDSLYHCASFVLLDKEELCIDSEPSTPMQVTVYGFALYQAYEYSGGTFHEASGSHIPVAVSFEIRDGEYNLIEYWEPRDGSYYVKDIRDIFPEAVEEQAIDTQKYILTQKQDCYARAVEHGSVDTDSAIKQLFETIESSPAYSSNPDDYIDEHLIQYRELTFYGRYTLRYCFGQFLQGGQTGLHGHIMASACRDILFSRGEDAVDEDSATGQEWFDAFRSKAETLALEYGDEDMAAYYPGAWVLLQMLSGGMDAPADA